MHESARPSVHIHQLVARRKGTLKYLADLFRDCVHELRSLKSPPLPVGIFLVASLSFLLCRDKNLLALIKPHLEPLGELFRLGTDCLYSFLTLFLVPLIFILLTGGKPKDYGLSLGKIRLAIPLLLVLLAVLTGLAFLTVKLGAFGQAYFRAPESLGGRASLLWSYLVYMWAWEFINRGFLLVGLKRTVGVYAIYIQLLPFAILHAGKPPVELYGSILFGLVFGAYAYMVDSFVYCVLAHACFAFVIRIFIGSG